MKRTLSMRGRVAFTLVELLIVIGIFVILLAIAVPAFSSMMFSSEQSMAENAMKIGVAAGRDAALRAGAGRDGAAVFIFENKRIQVVPCVQAGTVEDVDNNNNPVTRQIFAPVNGFEPVKLPRSWTVRGYAAANSIDDEWYEDSYTTASRANGNWVFPETDFFDQDQGYDANRQGKRQSFMVRFEGGTGMLKPDPTPVLVLFPSESTSFRNAQPYSIWRADLESDLVRFVARVQVAPPSGTNSLDATMRQQLLGNQASDVILVRGVSQLAFCNERSLASALAGIVPQVRINDTSGCLYQVPASGYATKPQFVPGIDGSDTTIAAMNAWIENRLPQGNVQGNPLVPSEARIFTVQRYSGVLQEVTGTKNSQGVTQ
jgi:type II secretory pathway pseudopilin PulG